MATLTAELLGISQQVQTLPEEVKGPIDAARAVILEAFDAEKAIQVGAKLPDFTLSDAVGKQITKSELLAKGPVLITFYRGEWCPYCNLALRAFQKCLDDFQARGVTLVAISPELPDTSLTTVQKNELKFPVLSDVGNKFARALGIVWKQPDAMGQVFSFTGTDLKARNGDDSLEVPVPTTLLVDQNGVVRNVHTSPDWSKRIEPQVAIDWVNSL
ncbi:Thioredoxin peroxidase-like protein [Cladobotryum mycophilum]|uniref:thioredoxin-dependent peroxiredoxin n=1 Tax=Cladobotryum mycophilum TaxID=491253 RepID=A0ABR0SIW5_9HYPO